MQQSGSRLDHASNDVYPNMLARTLCRRELRLPSFLSPALLAVVSLSSPPLAPTCAVQTILSKSPARPPVHPGGRRARGGGGGRTEAEARARLDVGSGEGASPARLRMSERSRSDLCEMRVSMCWFGRSLVAVQPSTHTDDADHGISLSDRARRRRRPLLQQQQQRHQRRRACSSSFPFSPAPR